MAKKTNVYEIPKTVDVATVGIYYYIDEESGEKVYDFESMAEEFENELSKITECIVMCSIKGE